MSTTQSSVDWYNDNADSYARHIQNSNESLYHHYYEKPAMYNLLPDSSEIDLLCMGCASGEDARHLQSMGATVHGIDISSQLIAIAQNQYPDISFAVIDMEKLDFADRSFDVVYASLAVHYIDDWTRMMNEAFRVLRPGGTFLFSCNHPVQNLIVGLPTENDHITRKGFYREKDIEKGIVTVTSNYFSHAQKNISLDKQHAVINFPKTFADIVRYSVAAGFRIDEIVEPLPLPELASIDKGTYDTLMAIPQFVVVKLGK